MNITKEKLIDWGLSAAVFIIGAATLCVAAQAQMPKQSETNPEDLYREMNENSRNRRYGRPTKYNYPLGMNKHVNR